MTKVCFTFIAYLFCACYISGANIWFDTFFNMIELVLSPLSRYLMSMSMMRFFVCILEFANVV